MAVNSQKRRRGLIAIVAAVIAAGAFVFALSLNNSGQPLIPGVNPGATPAPVATVPAVVAIADIKQGDALSATNIAIQQRRADSLPPTPAGGAPVFYGDVATLVGSPHYASIALANGTVLQTSMVVSSASGAKSVVTNVVDLKPGDVAVTVPYTVEVDAGGYIQPEDHIDILMLTDDAAAKNPATLYWAFQDVRVIRIGGPSDGGAPAAGPAAATFLLLELPRGQAGALVWDLAHKVTLHMVLRPRALYGKGKLPGSDQITGSTWPNYLDG